MSPSDRSLESTTQPEVDSPRTLGRYRIDGVLGRGGFGVVYRGVDPVLGRSVAIKALRADRATPTLRARLRREAELAARLQHPGIVVVHEVGSERDVDFIVMDLIEGAPLDEAAAEAPLARRIEWLAQVAEAVGVAHAAGVLHRDLKPANVMLTPDGRAVVTDFGLARAPDVETLTRTGEAPGTLVYMAPEQLRAERDQIGPPADVWALGVMLYELLAGRRPFDAPTAGAAVEQILRARPARPSTVSGASPPRALEAVCLAALVRDPAGRFADAGQMAADLRRWQRGERVRVPRPRSRRRGLAAGLLLVVAIGLLALGWGRRRQAFVAARARALAAHAAGDWAASLAAGERALAIRAEPALEELLTAVRARQAAARAAQAAAQVRRVREREQAQTLERIAGRIEQTRALFYIADVDIRGRLDALEAELGALARLLETAALRDHAPAWTLLGMGWYFIGRPGRAAVCLERALRLAPQASRAAHYLQRVYIEQSQLLLLRDRGDARAPQLAERARALAARVAFDAEVSPVDRVVARAFAAIATGDSPAARALCRAGIEAHAGELGVESLYLALGWTLIGEDAVRAWSRGLARCPHGAWLLLYRGTKQFLLGRTDAALADLDRAIAVNPHLDASYVNRAAVLSQAGEHERALADLDRAIELTSDNRTARSARTAALLALGRLADARAEADRLVAQHAAWVEGYRLRAVVLERLGDLPAARRDYLRAIELAPRDPATYSNRAQMRHNAGDRAGARQDLDRALALDPGHARNRAQRGALRLIDGDLAGALQDAEAAHAADPSAPHGQLLRARVRQARGERGPALADFDALLRRHPGHAAARVLRGALHAAGGDWARALVDFSEAARRDPRRESAWVNRAEALQRLGRRREAIEALGKALALNPRRARSWYQRANLRFREGAPAAAEADLERALAVRPDFSEALALRGVLRANRGRRAEGLADLQRATQLAPSSWWAWQTYGRVLAAAGRRAEAAAAFRRALQVAPAEIRPTIERMLRQVGG